MSRPRKPKGLAYDRYEARTARPRVQVMLSLARETNERLAALAEALGESKSGVVEMALRALGDSTSGQ